MILPKVLSKRHVVFLLLLIAVDMLATMVWYSVFGVGEANPLLSGPMDRSLVAFVLVKLTMSLPGLLFLYRKIEKKLSQIGLLILLTWYIGVFIFHWYIFVELFSGATIL